MASAKQFDVSTLNCDHSTQSSHSQSTKSTQSSKVGWSHGDPYYGATYSSLTLPPNPNPTLNSNSNPNLIRSRSHSHSPPQHSVHQPHPLHLTSMPLQSVFTPDML